LFTNGRWLGHGGYGGQFLMVDPQTATAAAFLSVFENDSAYDEAYMTSIVIALEAVLVAAGASQALEAGPG
jgi:CubicO group peptidase (beta-lactamase class C family)